MIARHFAYAVGGWGDNEVNNIVYALTESILRQKEVSYVVLLDHNQQSLISKYTHEQYEQKDFLLPEDIQAIPHNGSAIPVLTPYILDDEQLYDIGARVVCPEGLSPGQLSPVRCSEMTVHIGISLSNMSGKLLRSFALSVSLFILCIVFLGILGYVLVTQLFVTPILKMSEVTIQISKGNLSPISEVASENEIGALETALQQMLQSFITFRTHLQEACDNVRTISDHMLSLIENHLLISQKYAISIEQTHRTIEEIAASSEQIAMHTGSVTENSESTLNTTLNIGGTLQHTMTSMHDIRTQVGKNRERVVLLGEKISQISNVVKIINTIADQTRLIAFNASIEAAGAGESGGRFAVVATEVRRLANTVVESLEDIRRSVSSIQIAASELILSSETGIRKVNQGDALIIEIDHRLQEMLSMMENTTKSAREIFESIQQQQYKTGLIVEGMQEIVFGAEQSLDRSRRITEIAQKLHLCLEKLDTAIQKFGH